MLSLGLSLPAEAGRPVAGAAEPPNTDPMNLRLQADVVPTLTDYRRLHPSSWGTEAGNGGGGVSGGVAERLLGDEPPAQFLTGPVPSGGMLLQEGLTVAFSISARDPNNAGETPHYRLRAKLFKRAANGDETPIGTYDDDAVLTTATSPALTWNGTLSGNTAFAAGDRLGLRLYVIAPAGGNIAGGFVSVGVGDADWQSSITIPTTVAFEAE